MVQSIILTGPTAVGKSSLAIELAEKLSLEIINADSVCFYQEFNVGSAKPNADDLSRVPHHLINIAHPLQNYHAGQFLRDFNRVLDEIHQRGKRALIVGGSGFYLKSLRLGLWEAPETSPEFRAEVEGLETSILFQELLLADPAHAQKVGPADRYRIIRALEIFRLSGKKPSELQSSMSDAPNPQFQLWVVDRDKEALAARMRTRIQEMIRGGLIEETQALLQKYPESKTLRAVGYEQVLQYLAGTKPEGRKLKPGIEGLIDEIELSHRQLAKHQRTWFRNLKPDQSFILDQDRDELAEKMMKLYQ